MSKRVEESEARRHSAALVIQRAWRIFSAKRTLLKLRRIECERRHCAAQCIQTAWRCHNARMQLNKLKKDHR
jgi:IQ calmodulin-binding motif